MEWLLDPKFILFFSFAVFLIIRMPIAIALIVSSLLTLVVSGDVPSLIVIQRLFAGTNDWVLMAIPFFMLAGAIMEAGGVTLRIVNFANSLLGFLPGGMAAVNIAASMIFGGISGSAVADSSAIGSLLIPTMKRQGYDAEFASAVTASSSPIGMIIPPSIPMVLWSFISGVSLGALFLGGIIPGIMVGLSQIMIATVISVKRGYKASQKFSLENVLKNAKSGLLALLAPVIIIVGIVAGIFTPTEAAVVAVIYTLFLSMVIYKELSWKDLPKVILDAAYPTAVVMLIVAGANVFSWVMTFYNIPELITTSIMSLVSTQLGFMVLGALVFFILGMFMDVGVIVLLVGPLMAPLIEQMGIDPIHAAMIFLVVLATGLITPPVGLCLFVVSGISNISVEKIAKESLPFLIGLLIIAILLWVFPQLTLWIPSILT